MKHQGKNLLLLNFSILKGAQIASFMGNLKEQSKKMKLIYSSGNTNTEEDNIMS